MAIEGEGDQNSAGTGGIDWQRRGRQARIGDIPVDKLQKAADEGMTIEYNGDASTTAGTPVADVNKTVLSGVGTQPDRRGNWQKFKDLFKRK